MFTPLRRVLHEFGILLTCCHDHAAPDSVPQDANPKLVEWMTALCTSENPVFSGLMSTASVAVCQALGLPPTAGIDEILELADGDMDGTLSKLSGKELLSADAVSTPRMIMPPLARLRGTCDARDC